MNPRRGITATSAAVRCRRRSGEARAIRRGAASAALWRQARAEILTVVPLSLQPHQLWIVVKSCLSVKVEPPLAVASQTLTASHFSRGLVAWDYLTFQHLSEYVAAHAATYSPVSRS